MLHYFFVRGVFDNWLNTYLEITASKLNTVPEVAMDLDFGVGRDS
jgi:hypothetical protein